LFYVSLLVYIILVYNYKQFEFRSRLIYWTVTDSNGQKIPLWFGFKIIIRTRVFPYLFRLNRITVS
jgi:hypothetical protein